MKEITPSELQKILESEEDCQLIDVREQHEADAATIGGDLIPMQTVFENLHRIPKDKKVVIYCRSGNRSGLVITMLEKQHGYGNLYNLKGGLLAYANEIGI